MMVAKDRWRRSTVYEQFQWTLAGGVVAAPVAAPGPQAKPLDANFWLRGHWRLPVRA
jgi:hypothetical protein